MKTEKRIESGVSLLVWMLVYGAAIAVLFLDLLVWRP